MDNPKKKLIIKADTADEFVLYNRTRNTLRYRIYLEDAKNKKNMTEWIKIYPKSIILHPLEKKDIAT